MATGISREKFDNFHFLLMICTDRPPTDPLVHVIALERHYRITVPLNVRTTQVKSVLPYAALLARDEVSLAKMNVVESR